MTMPATGASNPDQGLTPEQARAEIAALLSREDESQKPADSKQDAPKPEKKAAETQPDPKGDAGDSKTEATPEADAGEQDDVAEEEQTETKEREFTPRKYRVKVDGTEEEVSEDELLRGYSREAHFTRNMQKLRKEQQEFRDAEIPQLRSERARLAELLEKLDTAMAAEIPQDVDWDRMRRENPEQFAIEYADFQYKQNQRQRVQVELEKTRQKIAEDNARQLREHVTKEQAALRKAFPEWSDDDAFTKAKSALFEYGINGAGFSEDDLTNVVEHKALVVLEKARRYDALMAKQQREKKTVDAKIEKAKHTPSPGAAGTGTTRVTSDLTRQRQRFAKTGSREDAARLLEMEMEAEDRLRRSA